MNLEKSVVAKTGFCKPIANPKQVVGSPNDLNAVSAGVISSPNDLGSVAKSNLDAPNLITPNAYSDLPPFPETHGRILYNNLMVNAQVTITDGVNGDLTLTPNTFEGWVVDSISGGDAFLEFLLPSNIDIDTLAIGAHNLADDSISYKWQYSSTDGGAYTDIITDTLALTNNPKLTVFTSLNVRKVRLAITGSGGFKIGVLSGGESLQLQRPKYGGVNPAPLNAVTDYFNNRSEAGEWIGRTIRRRGFESSIDLVRITPTWYRDYFQPFVESAKVAPFFYSWRPEDYPDDVVYCWTDTDIRPSNSGKREFMNVNFRINCHGSV